MRKGLIAICLSSPRSACMAECDWVRPFTSGFVALLLAPLLFSLRADGLASASSAQPEFAAGGAMDGDRFSAQASHAWKGQAGNESWWWEVSFPLSRKVGAILQVQGDHGFVLTNAPLSYVWQSSLDGKAWRDLPATRISAERRTYRLHRLSRAVTCQHLRLLVHSVTGAFPALREVEFYEEPKATIDFPDWIVVVNTTHWREVPNHGQDFIPLAKSCQGWEHVQAQQVWLGSFDEAFLAVEPRPLCAFLSGNFKDWCEVDRNWWRGTQEVLKNKHLPMWASCGGAQGLALLSEYGVDHKWDCPHCRDPEHPLTPIYTHLGHNGAMKACGDYSGCVFERGKYTIRQVARDPAFNGLSRDFPAEESHCGQIAWPPKGWELVATAGPGTITRSQCLRLRDRYVYAAQFHI